MIAVLLLITLAQLLAIGISPWRVDTEGFARPYLLLGLFALQALVRTVGVRALGATPGVLAWALVCLVMLVLLAGDARRPGVSLVACGFASNLLVILLNGAMPVGESLAASPDVVAAVNAAQGLYVFADTTTALPFLGDVLPVPGGALASLGDLLLMVGVSIMLFAASSASTLDRDARAVPNGFRVPLAPGSKVAS